MFTFRRIRRAVTKTSVRVPVVWARHRRLNQPDAFIASYPRSGSTWLRFLLLEVLSGESSGFRKVDKLIPDVGKHRKTPPMLPDGGRVIKTHEAFRPEYKKAVYLARDARDVVLSEYAYQTALGLVSCNFDDYLLRFLRGKVNGYGSWQAHVISWLDASLDESRDIRVVKFEDLRRNGLGTIGQILDFFGVRVDPKVIERAIANNSIQQMREKERVTPQRASKRGRFIRNGLTGAWRERLTGAQVRVIQQYAGSALSRLGYLGGNALADRGNQGVPPATGSLGAETGMKKTKVDDRSWQS